jgi:hypothetical protein
MYCKLIALWEKIHPWDEKDVVALQLNFAQRTVLIRGGPDGANGFAGHCRSVQINVGSGAGEGIGSFPGSRRFRTIFMSKASILYTEIKRFFAATQRYLLRNVGGPFFSCNVAASFFSASIFELLRNSAPIDVAALQLNFMQRTLLIRVGPDGAIGCACFCRLVKSND